MPSSRAGRVRRKLGSAIGTIAMPFWDGETEAGSPYLMGRIASGCPHSRPDRTFVLSLTQLELNTLQAPKPRHCRPRVSWQPGATLILGELGFRDSGDPKSPAVVCGDGTQRS